MMMQSHYAVVFVTTGNAVEAQRIANILISERKAACVNIVPQVRSRFWWKGKIDSADETLLVIKTKVSLLDELNQLVRENHSYEVPEIIALPIIGGNQDYLKWIDDELGKQGR